MKGIGILLVIICHFWGWNHPFLAQIILSFHMPLFFFVAGYYSKAYVDGPTSWNNVKHYFRRLIPPMAITQLLIVIWAVFMAIVKQGEGWDNVIREALSLFWADVDGPMTPWGKLSLGVIWFLVALFIAKSLLIPLSRLKQLAIPVSLVFAFGALLLHRVFPYSIWCLSLGVMALPFVTMGWWVKNHPLPLWFNIAALGCWVIAIWFSRLEMYTFTWHCFPLDVVGAYGGIYFVYLVSKWAGKNLKYVSKCFAYLGTISLSIMCIHCFELASHLGNHVRVFAGIDLHGSALYIWRFVLTIGLSILLAQIPRLRNRAL